MDENITESASRTSTITFETGTTDEDRLRHEEVTVTSWTDNVIGITINYAAEDTRITTYTHPDRARSIAHAILTALGDEA